MRALRGWWRRLPGLECKRRAPGQTRRRPERGVRATVPRIRSARPSAPDRKRASVGRSWLRYESTHLRADARASTLRCVLAQRSRASMTRRFYSCEASAPHVVALNDPSHSLDRKW